MAVEKFHENVPSLISPRISFSQDFCELEKAPIERQQGRTATADFNFCTRKSLEGELSSAAELFYNGKIRPVKIKQRAAEKVGAVEDDAFVRNQSFVTCHGVDRSSSHNCVSTYDKAVISRSNSTGSTPSLKRPPLSKPPRSHQQSPSSSKHHRSHSKKSAHVSSYGNGVRVDPIINVPSGNLSCLKSIFFGGKEKGKQKK